MPHNGGAAAVLEKVARDGEVEHLGNELHLEQPVGRRAGREGGARVHLEQPRLEARVNHHVVAVALEAVLVVDDDVLHRLERVDDEPADRLHQVLCRLRPARPLDVRQQVLQRPLPPVRASGHARVLLDGHVGQVDHVVVELGDVVRVVESAETREAPAVHKDPQRPVREHQHVDAQVELFAANQQRVGDVARADVHVLVRRHVLAAPRQPPLDLAPAPHDEDADALRLARRLHDPHRTWRALELLGQKREVPRQDEGGGDAVEVALSRAWCATLALLGKHLLQLAAVALEILHHQVLACELKVVREVVDELVVAEPDVVLGIEDMLDAVW
mmetsp:Transcript_833/g.2497  ORF Transcript_833/g.2497 Transcript_833/m.2497 type:complete len:331 (-) Transcript_833:234-1226(-)